MTSFYVFVNTFFFLDKYVFVNASCTLDDLFHCLLNAPSGPFLLVLHKSNLLIGDTLMLSHAR